MIKRFNQFVNESLNETPGPNTPGCDKMDLTEEDMDMFTSEPVLNKLIEDLKVALFDTEVWYFKDDTDTFDKLSTYLP